MEWAVGISILIALYAAIVSTYLGYRELKKERRKLSIFLEYIPFYERVNFRFVNSGMRPITIVNIGLTVYEENDGVNPPHWEEVPGQYIIRHRFEDGTQTLPAIIKDGEQVVIPIETVAGNMLIRNGMRANIKVYDAEGNIYTEFKTVESNPKEVFVAPIKE